MMQTTPFPYTSCGLWNVIGATLTMVVLFLPKAHGQSSAPSVIVEQTKTLSEPSPQIASAQPIDLSGLNQEQMEHVRFLEMPPPRLELSAKLQALGFSASYRFSDSQKQLMAMAASKDLPGLVKLLTGKDYTTPSDIDDAAHKLQEHAQHFIVAVLSDNITVRGSAFNQQGETPQRNGLQNMNVLRIPPDPQQVFMALPDGHMQTKKLYASGPAFVTDAHPTNKGFLYYAPHGDYALRFYLDWSNYMIDGHWDHNGPSSKLLPEWAKLETDINGFNKQFDLGEFSSEQLLEKCKARYQEFRQTADPLIRTASGSSPETQSVAAAPDINQLSAYPNNPATR